MKYNSFDALLTKRVIFKHSMLALVIILPWMNNEFASETEAPKF